ncbi:diguanylate phosphodiesterase [Hylemonella gracilis str. Niagara R]|uniref:Diguanylate phosphodiesterase n=1 Tax=Hylemonella gracilis str. Niagara R TaxID=1458275 RepID=A0A016XJU1_9BURK|nr:EAL domain-containing protein [Hylemonella gracilis]EYC51478.1 diguanylate phosphodiesterase [Hylemonella gracilis str. Niagara R]
MGDAPVAAAWGVSEVERRQASRLYGAAWADALLSMQPVLQDQLEVIVEKLFRSLAEIPSISHLILTMAEPEQAQFKARLREYLLTLTAPDLNAEGHRQLAGRLGLQHAVMGVARDDLTLGSEILLGLVRDHVGGVQHGRALAALGQRLMRDMSLQMQVYQEVQIQRHKLTQELTQLVWQVESYTDLIDRMTQRLSEHGEIAACSFGRLDNRGVFRFEAVSGQANDFLMRFEQLAGGSLSEVSEDPTGRAWRTRQVQRCINFATDPATERWRGLMRERGYRSSVAIPVGPSDGAPFFVLTLFCTLPGGFSSTHQQSFIEQLQTLLVFALMAIEARHGPTRVVPYATRQHWASLLRTDALEMHYQPLLDLQTGSVSKVEALARLREDGRLLGPGEFFAALLPSDFVELYARGLREVLRQRSLWRDAGLDLAVSLNLPSSALVDPRYFDVTQRILLEQDCEPEKLTLELLETGAIGSSADAVGVFHKFKSLGVKLAEDDLGAGYSGLARLREMPFDLIKIDRSIVQNLERDTFDVLRFIYQLTRLGHALGKRVALEGVEDPGLLEAVRILGVDAVQGYAVAQPMPGAALLPWLQTQGKARSAASARPKTDGVLARLARLLVWEERLHLHLEHASEQGDTTAGPPLPTLFGDRGRSHADQAVAVARLHGMLSLQYQHARQGLILAISSSD